VNLKGNRPKKRFIRKEQQPERERSTPGGGYTLIKKKQGGLPTEVHIKQGAQQSPPVQTGSPWVAKTKRKKTAGWKKRGKKRRNRVQKRIVKLYARVMEWTDSAEEGKGNQGMREKSSTQRDWQPGKETTSGKGTHRAEGGALFGRIGKSAKEQPPEKQDERIGPQKGGKSHGGGKRLIKKRFVYCRGGGKDIPKRVRQREGRLLGQKIRKETRPY